VLQPENVIALCPRRQRFTLAEADVKHDAGHKTADIWRMPVSIFME
jgi:hypothetical protein